MKTATPTLRRNCDAYFRDVLGDWIACRVLNVSGSGRPVPTITVKLLTRSVMMNGHLKAGVILEKPASEVIPKTALKFDAYGHTKSAYVCQETYPDRKKRKRWNEQRTSADR